MARATIGLRVRRDIFREENASDRVFDLCKDATTVVDLDHWHLVYWASYYEYVHKA